MNSFGRAALIVANGELPAPEILASLLAYKPFILAADGGVDRLLERGVIADAVLGDFDTASNDLPSTIIRIPAPDQNYTDLDKAIVYLIDEGYDQVWITGATGDRLDHTFGALSVLLKHAAKVEIALVDNIGTARPVEGPEEIETEIGQIISLITLGIVEGIKTTGLRWNLTNEVLAPGVRDGISNQAVSTVVTIEKMSGPLIVYIHHQ